MYSPVGGYGIIGYTPNYSTIEAGPGGKPNGDKGLTKTRSAFPRPAEPIRPVGGINMTWKLTLYIAGNDARSTRTESKLRQLCEQYLDSNHALEVVDVTCQPERAESENILITPTVIRRSPKPTRRVVGDLSDIKAVLYGLDLLGENAGGGSNQQ